jgi:very-short-patch-repair endonuclease
LEESFEEQLREAGESAFLRQSGTPYAEQSSKRCRADFFWPAERLVVEIQGGTWTGGRHIRGVGYARDCRKLNDAARNGYYTLFFTTEMVTKDFVARDTTLAMLERLRSS